MASALIIIPSFNEKENLPSLIEQILGLQLDVDVLVVDDSSPDGTAEAVRATQKEYPDRVNLIVREGKGGRGSAVLHGFQWALARAYPLVFEMDADFSHNPKEIPRFLERIKTCDMVVGSRYLPESRIYHWGWRRTFFSRWANRYARLILGIPLTDYTNGYRCYRREAVASIDCSVIEARGYVVLSEVSYQLFLQGKRIAEVPTIFVNRRRGISNLSFHEIKEAFLSVLRIRLKYRTRFSRPRL